jgi:hypothetical protein
MKKQILLGLLMASTTAVIAQPILTKATNDPIAGDVFYGYITDTNHVDKGAAGASVTWDMSTIIKNDSDTTSYFSCAATPYCDSFPGSNIVMLNSGDYAYGISGTNGIEMIGAYSTGNFVHFTNNNTLTHFPLSFGANFSDTFSTVATFSGMSIYFTGYNTSNCDAWGILKLPGGTYTNVLRVHTIVIQKDSVNFGGFPNVNIQQTETYTWFKSGFHSPLLTVNYDTSGSGTPYVSDAIYHIAPSGVGVNGQTASKSLLAIYPNPATENISLAFDGEASTTATITVLDMAGQVKYTVTADQLRAGKNEVNISLAEFANGLYLVRVQRDGNVATGRFTVVR